MNYYRIKIKGEPFLIAAIAETEDAARTHVQTWNPGCVIESVELV